MAFPCHPEFALVPTHATRIACARLGE
jgi:hypothetical protein